MNTDSAERVRSIDVFIQQLEGLDVAGCLAEVAVVKAVMASQEPDSLTKSSLVDLVTAIAVSFSVDRQFEELLMSLLLDAKTKYDFCLSLRHFRAVTVG